MTATKGGLFRTPTNQHRLVLGITAAGEVAFATRGEGASPDYGHCEIQPLSAFMAGSEFVEHVSPVELSRVENDFAAYISAKGLR
jgi:hypothetical protein